MKKVPELFGAFPENAYICSTNKQLRDMRQIVYQITVYPELGENQYGEDETMSVSTIESETLDRVCELDEKEEQDALVKLDTTLHPLFKREGRKLIYQGGIEDFVNEWGKELGKATDAITKEDILKHGQKTIWTLERMCARTHKDVSDMFYLDKAGYGDIDDFSAFISMLITKNAQPGFTLYVGGILELL